MEGNNQEMNVMNFNQAETDEYFRSLPPGYRFNPNDQELILYYLNPKILNQPLPLNRIHDLNIYQYNPRELSERFDIIREDGWYFFCTRERKYQNGSRPNRAAHDGKWKATGCNVEILDVNGQLIGYKRVLDFRKGTHTQNINTEWKMHEYTVIDYKEDIPLPKRKKGEGDMKLDVVLCKIYLNTRSTGKTNKNDAVTTANSDQGIRVTYTAGTSHDDKHMSGRKHEVCQVQPLGSSPMSSMQPQAFNNMHQMSMANSSTIPENCLYSSTSMSSGVNESPQYTHYGGSMTNEASGCGWRSFSEIHHQNHANSSMFSEQIPSSSTSHSTEIWTKSEPVNHDMPLVDDSVSVSFPANVIEYEQSMLVTKNEAEMMPAQHVNKVDEADDDDGLQFLNIPDEVHENYSKADGFIRNDSRTNEDDPGQNRLIRRYIYDFRKP